MIQPLTRDQGGNIETWTVAPSKAHKLRSRCYKGIPDRWRAAAWEVLMAKFSQVSNDGGKRQLERLTHDYEEAMDKPSQYDVQIDLDVPRTISGHVMFKTRYGAG
jgi:USP6 N-terminal-like protein